jgi:hypothetical protein
MRQPAVEQTVAADCAVHVTRVLLSYHAFMGRLDCIGLLVDVFVLLRAPAITCC